MRLHTARNHHHHPHPHPHPHQTTTHHPPPLPSPPSSPAPSTSPVHPPPTPTPCPRLLGFIWRTRDRKGRNLISNIYRFDWSLKLFKLVIFIPVVSLRVVVWLLLLIVRGLTSAKIVRRSSSVKCVCVFVSRPMKIVTFPRKNGDLSPNWLLVFFGKETFTFFFIFLHFLHCSTFWGQCTLSGRRNAAFPASGLCTELASTIPMQQMVPVYFLCPDGSQTSQQTETWFINLIVPAQKTHGCKL